MELTGTITQVLPLDSGTSKSGKEYNKLTIIIRYDENSQYPKELAVTYLNQNALNYVGQVAPGLQVRVKFDATSREYNGRWYTEAIGWKLECEVAQPQPYTQPQPYAPAPGYAAPPTQGYVQPQQGYAAPTQGYTPPPSAPYQAAPQQPAYAPPGASPYGQPQNPPYGGGHGGPTSADLPFK